MNKYLFVAIKLILLVTTMFPLLVIAQVGIKDSLPEPLSKLHGIENLGENRDYYNNVILPLFSKVSTYPISLEELNISAKEESQLNPAPLFFYKYLLGDKPSKFLALVKGELYNNIDLFIVRQYEYDNLDSPQDSIRKDYLFRVKDSQIVGDPIKISHYNFNHPDTTMSFFFSHFFSFITISEKLSGAHSGYPCKTVNETVNNYFIDENGQVDIETSTEFIAIPENLEQFKQLFNGKKNLSDIGKYLNLSNPSGEKLERVYTLFSSKYKGFDVYVFERKRELDFEEHDINTESESYCLLLDEDDNILQTFVYSYSISGEGGEYNLDSELSSEGVYQSYFNSMYESATGFRIRIVTRESRFFDPISGITKTLQFSAGSDFFNLKIINSPSFIEERYPTKDDMFELYSYNGPYSTTLFFFLTPSKKGGLCIQFVSKLLENNKEIILDEKCLCLESDNAIDEIKPKRNKEYHHSNKIVIETSSGKLLYTPDGRIIQEK